MKRFVLFLIFMLSMVNLVEAQSVGQVAKGMKPDGTFAPILLDANGKLITNAESTGDSGVGTYTLILPAIYSSTKYNTILATGTRKLLTEIASFSDGDLIMFQGQGQVRWDLGDITVTDLQSYGTIFEAKAQPMQCHLRTGQNISFVADVTGGIATFGVTVCRER